MRVFSKPSVEVDEENPYWVSFSDIMAALVVIFVLASLVLLMQLMKVQEQVEVEMQQLQEAEQVRRTIVSETVDELKQKGVDVEVAENHTVIRIPNELLGFDTGSFDIEQQYRSTAATIGQVLADVIRKEDRTAFLDTIFVEGHTDSRTFHGPPGKGNWGLSTFRAISLWEFWQHSLTADRSLEQLKNRDGKPLFSVSGYGPTRPVIENQYSDEHYRSNRRVDIRITIRRPDQRDYEAIQKIWEGPL